MSPPPPAEQREAWGNQCDFFLTSLGLAVGLGNLYRFPYVAFNNGGGTFLIPYLIMLFLVGLPGLFLEQSIGQYGRVAINKIYGRMAPIFRGLGYGMLVCSYMNDVYYAVILGWCIFYLVAGFTTELPWGTCEDDYNTYDCYSKSYQAECDKKYNETGDPATIYYKQNCTELLDYCTDHNFEGITDILNDKNETVAACVNEFNNVTQSITSVINEYSISPAEDYFNGFCLGLYVEGTKDGTTHDLENYGVPRWQLILCLACGWTLITLVLIKGIQSYGKAAYVITLSPYFILTALIIYAAQLPGADKGIEFYITPQWDRLLEFQVWTQAASQICFSLGIGFGSQLILATYNRINNNTFRDGLLISLFNSGTSVYAGFVVFSVIGFLADSTGKEIEDTVEDGIKLAFVVYPSAVLEMDVSPLWSFLFFFMLLNLALSSSCGGVQNFVAFIQDQWPTLRPHRLKILVCVNFSFFVCGLSMTFNGGLYLFNIFDLRLVASLLLSTIAEFVLVGWVFGIENFLDALSEMEMDFKSGSGIMRGLGWFWRIMICGVTPIILVTLVLLTWIEFDGMELNGKTYPGWAEGLGWFIELVPVSIAVLYPLYAFYAEGKKLKKENSDETLLHKLTSPTRSWYETDRSLNGGDVAAKVERAQSIKSDISSIKSDMQKS